MARALPLSVETPAAVWNDLLLALGGLESETVLELAPRALKAIPMRRCCGLTTPCFIFNATL